MLCYNRGDMRERAQPATDLEPSRDVQHFANLALRYAAEFASPNHVWQAIRDLQGPGRIEMFYLVMDELRCRTRTHAVRMNAARDPFEVKLKDWRREQFQADAYLNQQRHPRDAWDHDLD